MSSREFILANVRRRQPAATALPLVPVFDHGVLDPLATFGAALERMGGTLAAAPRDISLDDFIRGLFPDAPVICSATAEVRGTRAITVSGDPRALADVDVGVVRAAFGVAETGSVALGERELGVNALAFLSQHLVVLLDPAAILRDIAAAYCNRQFFQARYAVLLTGPSATADIEGVLVRGAQGIRSLTVIPTPAPQH